MGLLHCRVAGIWHDAYAVEMYSRLMDNVVNGVPRIDGKVGELMEGNRLMDRKG